MGVESLSYKLDKTSFSSQFATYQIYDTWQIPFDISGSIPDLNYKLYQATFEFPQDQARARVSIQRPDTELKTAFNTGPRLATLLPTYTVYQYVSNELVQTSTHYQADGTLVISLFIYNETGGTINLISQRLNVFVELYIAPID